METVFIKEEIENNLEFPIENNPEFPIKNNLEFPIENVTVKEEGDLGQDVKPPAVNVQDQTLVRFS